MRVKNLINIIFYLLYSNGELNVSLVFVVSKGIGVIMSRDCHRAVSTVMSVDRSSWNHRCY